MRSGIEKQCRITRTPPASSSSIRACRRRPRGCGSRAACRSRARARSAPRTLAPGRRRARRRGSSRARSRRSRRTCGCAASACSSARSASSNPVALFGWRPIAANTCGKSSAAWSAARHDAPSVPTVTIRSTPCSTAASTSSASGGSQSSRWVWLSITGFGKSGSSCASGPAARAARSRPPGDPSAPRSFALVSGMYGSSSVLTVRRPSTSDASVSSSLPASAGSRASCHGARSSTYRFSRRTRRQIWSSASVGSARSISAATSCGRPSNSRIERRVAVDRGHDAVAVALDHRDRAAREIAVLVRELGVVARAGRASIPTAPSLPNGTSRIR